MITYAHLFRVFLKIGLLSFGGPAAQIAVMHRTLVEEQKWLSEREYLDALSFCMLLPGPEAMQVATFGGWRVRGILGGFIAGGLFVLPGALIMLGLAALYVSFAELTWLSALFLGIKATVLVIVGQALFRLSAKTLKSPLAWVLALISFCGLTFLGLPFPLIVFGAGLIGFVFLQKTFGEEEFSRTGSPNSGRQTLIILLVGAALWLLPLLLVEGILFELSWFFTKLAAVSFGGAYAGLSYMAQDLAQTLGVVTQDQMVDGLGLAETTPGPLILVTEFMAYIAADAGGALGLWGALLALWAIFVPSFVLVFALAPHVAFICAQPRLRSALNGISAAVVGVIAYLSIWFALSVFFGNAEIRYLGWLQIYQVDLATFDWRAFVLLLASAFLLLRLRLSLPLTLLFSALGGLAFTYAV